MADRTDGLTTEYDVRPMRDPDLTDPNNPDAIRADIQQTRERMSHTVENIGERLNPDRLKAQLKSTLDEKKAELKSNIHDATIGKAEQMARVAYDRVEETRHGIIENIRENPVPAAMVGIGLGWLFLSGRRNEDRVVRHVEYDRFSGPTYDRYAGSDARYYTPIYDDGTAGMGTSGGYSDHSGGATERLSEIRDTARERAEGLTHRAQERVSGIAEEAREKLHNVTDRAQEVIGSKTERVRDALGSTTDRARSFRGEFAADTRYRTHRVEDRFDEALQESPLAVGAAAVALGLAIGLSAPSTRRESELMGARRDELFDRARGAAEEAKDRVQEVASQVVDQAKSTIQEAASDASSSGTGTSGYSTTSGSTSGSTSTGYSSTSGSEFL
jgi:ElaB/YqjD/DUF883 family membrane-anchored ribosome-binding protein